MTEVFALADRYVDELCVLDPGEVRMLGDFTPQRVEPQGAAPNVRTTSIVHLSLIRPSIWLMCWQVAVSSCSPGNPRVPS